jgi:uncharacterized lipoprotein YmbA
MMRSLSSLLLSACVCLLASCAASKSYYVLTPEGPAPSGGGPGIGVGPVAVAGYLNRPNLVFQETDHRLAVAEDHRWAGDLEENISRVMAANLGRRLHTGNVSVYPWSDESGMRYQISMDIRQLHGTPGGDATIDASWRVYSLPDRRIVATRSWSGTERLTKDGYDELASAESRLLGHLAEQIASSIH